ncbi:MAG: 4Fe-4S binding protein [Coleofasciculaceae cyanobacterium]
MFAKIPEKYMHLVRWVLVISWLGLILSLFYDPISVYLTDPSSPIGFLKDPEQLVLVQGQPLEVSDAYPLGARLFWGMIVPSAIMFVLVFGHEAWRRICPLYFFSQIPRALGLEPRLDIEKNTWLIRNHLYLQFGLFFLGLTSRILFINSARPVLAVFLIVTILCAVTMVFLYGGRSWCHYVCPFGMVQMVFTGPRGLLDSQAHTTPSGSITQSMCRTIDKSTGKEISACLSCKKPCMDIDSEGSYWEQLNKPGRKLVQYGYVGLVVGYFLYYWLYAGNFNYYLSGYWTHETDQLASIFKPGFYLFNQAIPLPKLIAVPLTFAFFILVSYLICSYMEKYYLTTLHRQRQAESSWQETKELARHRVFSLCTFFAFNFFFIYGGRPEINQFSLPLQLAFQGLVLMVSSLWLYQTWGRSSEQYKMESLADRLRRKLKKLPIDFTRFFNGRSLEQLKANEVDIIYRLLPSVTKQDRLQVYKDILLDALDVGNLTPQESLDGLEQLRQKMEITEDEHYEILISITDENLEVKRLTLDNNPTKIRKGKNWHPADGSTRIRRPSLSTDNEQTKARRPDNQFLEKERTRIRPK